MAANINRAISKVQSDLLNSLNDRFNMEKASYKEHIKNLKTSGLSNQVVRKLESDLKSGIKNHIVHNVINNTTLKCLEKNGLLKRVNINGIITDVQLVMK